jgi:hypothetical protein
VYWGVDVQLRHFLISALGGGELSALPFGHFVPRERTASADHSRLRGVTRSCYAYGEEIRLFLCGCETWSLTSRELHRLRVFENRVLRNVLVPERDELTGDWRRLHNEELHDLYTSPNVIRVVKLRRMRWAGHLARGGGERCILGFGGET